MLKTDKNVACHAIELKPKAQQKKMQSTPASEQ